LIVGTGVDLTEIARIAESIARFGDRFLQRIYTPGEIAYCTGRRRGSTESFAARFAAKEAGAKALGTGIARGVSWREIEVERRPGSRPTVRFHGRAAERARRMGVVAAHLSLSHGRDLAIAHVVLENGALADPADGTEVPCPDPPGPNGSGC
jgi:holo-[acyl-carrier protein] synthase